MVNGIGDDVKKVVDSAVVTPSILANKRAQLLAMKKAQTQTAATAGPKYTNGFYYGMATGAMGVVTAAVLFAACKDKKKIQDNEQTLL